MPCFRDTSQHFITFVQNARTMCAWSLIQSDVHDYQSQIVFESIVLFFRFKLQRFSVISETFACISETMNILLCQTPRTQSSCIRYKRNNLKHQKILNNTYEIRLLFLSTTIIDVRPDCNDQFFQPKRHKKQKKLM